MPGMPVVVGFGGVNAAGRSSGHHGYRRTVLSALDESRAASVWRSLAGLTGYDGALDEQGIERLRSSSLIRCVEPEYFDATAAPWNRRVLVSATGGPLRFEISRRQLPDTLPAGWAIEEDLGSRIRVVVEKECELLAPDTRDLGVRAVGMVPTGFEPGSLYPARSHPRGLELTVFGASDALNSMGIDWQRVIEAVPADRFSTYAGSAMTQLDENGNGGLVGARYRGKRITSKHVPLALGQMAADFVNAYVLGSVGQTGHNMGACATFHYNLRLGVQDIREGRSRVAVVGGVETPILPDVMEGMATMGALVRDDMLLEIEGKAAGDTPNYRRACRPFGENGGFVMGEAAQFAVLMDAELALDLGADMLGGLGNVFVHADGHKKSISSPGVGNFITFAKAVADAQRVVGSESVQERSFVHAHGTGTPQNRTSESQILDAVARAFEIEDWPVAAIKCYVGHTMAAAGGDQLMSTLGTLHDGILPGIATIDAPAADVASERLHISPEHLVRDREQWDVAFLNAKGFGGNNATAWVVAPHVVERQLEKTHGSARLEAWRGRLPATRERAARFDQAASDGQPAVTYKFDHNVRSGAHVTLDQHRIKIEGCGTVEL